MADSLERITAALADRYRIEREIGQGGMARVYLAFDLKHDRRVALKVLHPELAAVIGTERFLAEIKTTANLQHPNILPLFDSGTADGLVYYVMPFVEGESLRDRLTRERQLPVEDAVHLGRSVAGALAYAHRHGVIHRDIKPENILLQEGQPLVADFGIALAVRTAGGARLTQTGLSLGTPYYMSPEQATGDRDLDARTDVYALGAVLYECLAGEAPFTGPNTQAVIARLLSEEPRPLSAARRSVPPGIEFAIHKALAKLPADRHAGAGSFADALAVGLTSGEGYSASTAAARLRPRPDRRRYLAVAGALAAVTAALGFGLGRAGPAPRRAFDVGLPDSLPIAYAKGGQWGEGWRALGVSPDGARMVYIADRGATTELWERSLVDLSNRPVPGSEGVSQFALSPDGSQVAVMIRGEGKVLPVGSVGTPTSLGRLTRVTGLAWDGPETVLLAELEGSALVRVHLPTGRRETTANLRGCYLPTALAEGAILCSGGAGTSANDAIHVVQGDQATPVSGPTGPVVGWDARWLDDRILLWTSTQGELMAAAWEGPGTQVGGAVRVMNDVRTEALSGAAQYALAGQDLVFAPGDRAGEGHLVSRRPGGVLDTILRPKGFPKQFDFSPDGRRVAITVRTALGDEAWIHDLPTGTSERWLAAGALDEPRWSPDGESLAVRLFDPARGVPVTVIGQPGSTTPVDTLSVPGFYPSHWARPDLILGHFDQAQGASEVVLVHLRTGGATMDTVAAPGAQSRATLSPDGKWLAFMSADEIVVEDFPGRRTRRTVGRGLDPLWAGPNELILRDGVTWHWIRLDPVTARPIGESQPAVTDPRFVDTSLRSQTLTADGRLVYVHGSGRTTGAYVRVLVGWRKELDRLVKGGR